MHSAKSIDGPATASDIRRILGDLSAEAIAAILDKRLSAAELVQVREWLDADAAIRTQLHRGASGAVAAVCDILADEELLPDDER